MIPITKPVVVLVTGGSGFVGQSVVTALGRRGHTVIATTTGNDKSLPTVPQVEWVKWDALHDPLPDAPWKEVQAVVHLAAPRNLFDFPTQAPSIYEVVTAATFRLLEAARRNHVSRVLIASTGDVLGHREKPLAEDDCCYQPTSFYGAAKAGAELLATSFAGVVSTAVLRFFHPFGPGGDRFLVNRLFGKVARGEEITIHGRDGIPLNPVWIEDLADGVCLAMESPASGVFHFAGPETLTLRRLVEKMGRLLHREPKLRIESGGPCPSHVGAFEKTRDALGFDPKVSVDEGLKRLLEIQPALK